MEAGIAAMVPGNRLTDVSHAIETGTHAAEARYDRKFGIVAGYGGHGIGRQMHMDPFLPNEGAPGRGPFLAPGSVLAIEPMLTLGTALGAHRGCHRRRPANPHGLARIFDQIARAPFELRVVMNRITTNVVSKTEVGSGRSRGRHDAGAL
jgi:methionine aminopeptidase